MTRTMFSLALDLSLVALTLWVAWRALTHGDLFVGVVLFIIFGLLLSLVWARLGAGDIALAEAAIGAGLTGALLLDAVAHLPVGPREGLGKAQADPTQRQRERVPSWLFAGSALLLLSLGGLLALVVVWLDALPGGGLTVEVTERLAQSGVAQPVTAVLVNFRGYDTLLEVNVLLLAGIGMLASRQTHDLSSTLRAPSGDPVLDWLVKLLVPVLFLAGVHLLFLGAHRAGGGFQAGAVFGATAILLILVGYRSVSAVRGVQFRTALLSGFAVFLVIAVGPMLVGGRLLEFPPAAASRLIFVVEAAIALTTGFTLAALFAGARPLSSSNPDRNDASPAQTGEQ